LQSAVGERHPGRVVALGARKHGKVKALGKPRNPTWSPPIVVSFFLPLPSDGCSPAIASSVHPNLFGVVRYKLKIEPNKPTPNSSVSYFLKTEWLLILEKPKYFYTEKPNRNASLNRMPRPSERCRYLYTNILFLHRNHLKI
jgi:hypothetical protein